MPYCLFTKTFTLQCKQAYSLPQSKPEESKQKNSCKKHMHRLTDTDVEMCRIFCLNQIIYKNLFVLYDLFKLYKNIAKISQLRIVKICGNFSYMYTIPSKLVLFTIENAF